jgi:hypothetical protein
MTEHILEKVCDLYFPQSMEGEDRSRWAMKRFDCVCTSVGLDYWEGYLYQKKDENNT